MEGNRENIYFIRINTRDMEYREIGKTGMKVSNLSFGASSLGGVFHQIDEGKAIEAVFAAITASMHCHDPFQFGKS